MPQGSSKAALLNAIQSQRSLGLTGDNWDNYAAAFSTLQREIGHFPDDTHLDCYEFDEAIRNRLLAHGRQDAAHALMNTASLLNRVVSLQRQVAALGLVTLSMLAVIAWKLWY
jgi:hypothetical protein